MDVIRFAISKPVTVTVGVILVIMFGMIGFSAIPIQLTPTVDRPEISINTSWPGRSPQEVVDEITKEQEERLKNVSNLKNMQSISSEGNSAISLEFYIGTDIGRALQEVSDALRQVPDYPEEVDEPVILAADGESENAIAWIIIDVDPAKLADHPDFDIQTIGHAVDRDIRPYLERVDGVAQVNVFGWRDREVQVRMDPIKAAQRGISPGDLIRALRGENANTSAGTISEGKRDVRVRVLGQYDDPEKILSTVVAHRDGRKVYVRDVATVEEAYQKRRGFVRSFGQPSLAINVIRQSGANVMSVMTDVRSRVDEIREDLLPLMHPTVGPDLRIRQVYDETTYITSAISLVQQNLWVGGSIAALVLLLFLRSFISTGVIVLAIPISVVATFLVLLALGRTLNVVSLAGLAFAVGMVVDNAIVVLENIYRKLADGDSPRQAAYKGGKEVWGAILASTLTTVAVFVPVLTIQEESGQLFRDISIAIVGAVTLSLIVSITVIPAACSRWLHFDAKREGPLRRLWHNLFGIAPVAGAFARGLAKLIHWLSTGWRGWTLRPAVIITMTFISIYGAAKLAPPLDYLPAGNQNLVFGGLLIPPGYSVERMEDMATRIEAVIKPYANARTPEEVAALPKITTWSGMEFDPVGVQNFFLGSFGGGMFVGATSQDPMVVTPIASLLGNAINPIPDVFGGASQASIFGRGIGGGNAINLEISGPTLAKVEAAAGMMYGLAGQKYGFGLGVQANPSNFNLAQPEWRLRITENGRELGYNTADVGTAVRAFFDGAFVGDYKLNGDTVDLVVLPLGGRLEYKEQLSSVPIATPSGRIVPIDSLVEIVPANAPQSVQRIEELPSISLAITPPEGVALETVMSDIERDIITPARQAGLIDTTMRIRLEGTAAKLEQVQTSLFGTREPGPPALLRTGWLSAGGMLVLGFGVAIFAVVKGITKKDKRFYYGSAGAILLATVLGALVVGFAGAPSLLTARLVWALVVTYLLMCALFESFIYPFVIMFTVPLAIVGGFLGLSIVHARTAANPLIATQQLDVLTMLGFVILVGVVVNNAILIVHQSLNFMRGEEGKPLEPLDAIRMSVQTRVRPIFMGTMTSVGGMLPLVLFPGAGSEMYRGLGSVVIGGLIMSTFFTLILVPLLFSLVLEMVQGLRLTLGMAERSPSTEPESGGRIGDLNPA